MTVRDKLLQQSDEVLQLGLIKLIVRRDAGTGTDSASRDRCGKTGLPLALPGGKERWQSRLERSNTRLEGPRCGGNSREGPRQNARSRAS